MLDIRLIELMMSFYAAYPELNGNLDPLISESFHHDDKLKIIT